MIVRLADLKIPSITGNPETQSSLSMSLSLHQDSSLENSDAPTATFWQALADQDMLLACRLFH